ncbi:hypothetical protein N1851_003707 [Merluccius polli]|uniref:Uncharacterized protein n=1 Tax=Merluccius polli TaxID=89951 RepID=A0AA47N950_MERPO|nr:hypothetical protein N1851_003707 [Merluccius polli]
MAATASGGVGRQRSDRHRQPSAASLPRIQPGAAQASRPSARGPGAQGPMLQEEMGGGSCLVALVEGGEYELFQALRELPPRPSCRASSEPIQPAPAASYPQRHLRQPEQQPQASGLRDGGGGWGGRVTLGRCGDTRTDNTHSRSRSLTRTEISDLATYLVRRDLLTSVFKVFDNKPETYISWKSMFCNGIEGLNLKASEELNLLTKWLDGESLQHALRIRAVHVNNPETGLRHLWQRLDKSYGSSEAIEASLFKRLESFPRISYKDNHLLQELADLLLELQAAKNEGYLPGLSFLDTSRGINPIVEKLPNNLQEAWIKQGTRYKKEHNAIYPPFSYFVEFVNSHAEMKTDPSFMLQGYSTPHPQDEKALVKQTKFRTPITANKIEIDTPGANADTPPLDPDKECPIHKLPHSLAKCRGFRMKMLDERKALLKELSICYKCCISTEHRAKDCKAVIHCSECNSNSHVSALHAGPPPWSVKDPKPVTEGHGGEPDNPNSIETSSSCTEVCGNGLQGK